MPEVREFPPSADRPRQKIQGLREFLEALFYWAKGADPPTPAHLEVTTFF